MANIVFYTTFSFTAGHASGSSVRPAKFLNFLKESDHEVTPITGDSKDRKIAFSNLKKKVQDGYTIDLVYCECGTLPFLLTDRDHIPRHPLLDISIFRYFNRLGVPFAVYYRDVYWKFPEMKTLHFLKHRLIHFAHLLEIKTINRYASILYLQSLPMARYLPEITGPQVKTLMPGTEYKKITAPKKHSGKLKIFYVGGMGTLYKMHSFVEAVSSLSDAVELTICCRPKEWEKVKHEYTPWIGSNVTIVSGSGDDLLPYFHESDIFHFCLEPHEYRKFVMPVKLFEYLSFRKPIIASKDTLVGDFVEKENIGWSVEYNKEAIASILRKIANNPNMRNDLQENIDRVSMQHSWEKRLQQVIDDCTSSS